MIRLIRRRLIIPRGDTGSFSIPTIGEVGESDVAIFGIFDPLTHKTLVMKKIQATSPTLTISFATEDTINLEPRKYNWDITIYKGPIYDEEGELIGAEEVNSYYSAYKLPTCEITEVALDMDKNRWKTKNLTINTNSYPNYFNNISHVYPWENMQLTALSEQIYKIAQKHGYQENEESFWDKFNNGAVIISTLANFPPIGDENKIYLDKESGILYYFIATTSLIYYELANAVGAIINKDKAKEITYLYLPIKAMPIQNLIISGGDINE